MDVEKFQEEIPIEVVQLSTTSLEKSTKFRLIDLYFYTMGLEIIMNIKLYIIYVHKEEYKFTVCWKLRMTGRNLY